MPNPDFENLYRCPTLIDDWLALEDWVSFGGSPDIFNACNADSLKGVPRNLAGYQTPSSGNGYGGLVIIDFSSPWREYYSAQLTNLLTPGVKYYASVKISLAECSNYSCNNFGIGFSTDSFHTTFLFPGSSLSNYLKINNNFIITDTTNWVTISGSFIADSAYKYIIIGNFHDREVTDTLLHNTGCAYKIAYYYLDDVCLSSDSLECSDFATSIKSKSSFTLNVHPNPAKDNIYLTPLPESGFKVNILNLSGQKIKSCQTWSNKLDIGDVPNGVYLVEIKYLNQSFYKKQLIIH